MHLVAEYVTIGNHKKVAFLGYMPPDTDPPSLLALDPPSLLAGMLINGSTYVTIVYV